MPKRLTKEEFIAKARAVHGERYDYSQVVYVGINHKVTIVCPIHGSFKQAPASHFRTTGCKKCGNEQGTLAREQNGTLCKWDTQTYVLAAKAVHGNAYDYSETVYVPQPGKVTIRCPKHGLFKKTASRHLAGEVCQKCRADNRFKPTKSGEYQLARFHKAHGALYSYELIHWPVHARDMVAIICSKHGVFHQPVATHAQGAGCKACALEANGIARRKPKEHYLARFSAAHGTAYDYSHLPDAFTATEKLTIVCPKHGAFSQAADTHASGKGCKQCATTSTVAQRSLNGSYLGWPAKRMVVASKKRRSATLYLIKCFNTKEAFYKIGVTSKSYLPDRFPSTRQMPYQYEIIEEVKTLDAALLTGIEKQLKQQLYADKYKPIVSFPGYSECFSLSSNIHKEFKLLVSHLI